MSAIICEVAPDVVVAFGPIARFAEIAPVLRGVLDSVRFDDPPEAR